VVLENRVVLAESAASENLAVLENPVELAV
jgi:hypothetical protein